MRGPMNTSRFAQSQYLDDAVSEKSIHESMMDFQKKQSGISSIIKLFSVLVMVVAFLIGYKIYLQQQPVDQKEWIQKEISELMSQKDQKKDSSWYWQFFGRNSRCIKHQNELKEIVPDVQPSMRNISSIEDLKLQGDEEINIKEIRQLEVVDLSFDEEVEKLNKEEQKQYYQNQYQQVETLDQILDEEKLFEIQKLAMNLKKSWQNFVTKKKRLSEFKKKLQGIQIEKEECVTTLENEQTEKQSLNEQIENEQQKLFIYSQEKQQIENEQEEQKKNLSEKEKIYLNSRIAIEKEIDSLTNEIKTQEKTKQKIKYLEEQNKISQGKLNLISPQLETLQKNIHQIDHQIYNDGQAITKLTLDYESLLNLRAMYELKLNYLTKESQIKNFMNTILNKAVSKEELNKLMEQKIKEETEFLKQMEELQNTSKTLSEDILNDFQYVSQDQEQLKEMVQKQKNNLQEFISKYNDLEKAIEEYKEEQLQIKYNQQKLMEINKHIQSFKEKIEVHKKSLNQNKKIRKNQQTEQENFEQQRNNLEESIRKNSEQIQQFALSLGNLQDNLSFKQEELKRLNLQYEPERIKHENLVKSNLNNLKSAENKIFETKAKISELQQQLHKFEQEKEVIKKRCVKIVQYIKQSNAQTQNLQREIQENQQKINELRNLYNQKLSSLLAQQI